MRIAMWSGPRNISTALLRSWGSRPDTVVCDEPLYAHYLLATGADHPGAAEVIAHHETDWRTVAASLTGPIPEGRAIFYQKHMAHHLLPQIERGWLAEVTSCFLIRDPREMLTSLLRRLPDPALADTGLPQQLELFQLVRAETGAPPPVLDARDVLEDPRRTLSALCARLGVAFTDAMLSWSPGPRPTDGVWAPHWYDAVERSTGFHPYRAKPDGVPPRLARLHAEARRAYDELHEARIR